MHPAQRFATFRTARSERLLRGTFPDGSRLVGTSISKGKDVKMKKTAIAAAGLALSTLAVPAYADDDAAIVTGTGGAVTGALVGGPVGAVIGGALGVITGAAINPPPKEVVTYVEARPVPAQKYIVKEELAVGKTLPDDVVLEVVPENDAYAYTVINDRRVIVQRDNHAIVQIVE
jgi:hypothetical protein